jgi:DMSO/TMAO reductase YedYZ molybdopterin-dependent catalytic subunit
MSILREPLSRTDANLLVKEAARLAPDPTRRLLLRGGLSLGALTFLTGCDIADGVSAEKALRAMSRFNDRAQAWLFDPERLAPTYPESAITRPFPFNAYYAEDDAPEVDPEDFKLKIGGLVDDKHGWTLPELYALPQETQITRHVCVEGWSAIG